MKGSHWGSCFAGGDESKTESLASDLMKDDSIEMHEMPAEKQGSTETVTG